MGTGIGRDEPAKTKGETMEILGTIYYGLARAIVFVAIEHPEIVLFGLCAALAGAGISLIAKAVP